jgi:uncharacterized membrane protein YphA (DoxX/SURF4 family)
MGWQESANRAAPDWTYDALRIGIAAVVVVPGASKFLTYGQSVAFFRALSIPEPAVLVIVVGIIEVGAAGLLFVDRWTPVAALALLPVVIVAALTAGPTWQNVGVFLGASGLGLVLTESGETILEEL